MIGFGKRTWGGAPLRRLQHTLQHICSAHVAWFGINRPVNDSPRFANGAGPIVSTLCRVMVCNPPVGSILADKDCRWLWNSGFYLLL